MKMITLEKVRDSLRDLAVRGHGRAGDRRPRPRRDRPHGRARLASELDRDARTPRVRLSRLARGRWRPACVASVRRASRVVTARDRGARPLRPGAQPRRRSTSSRCCRSRSLWGLAYAVAVSVASMLAFNFFFLEPVHTFTLADSRTGSRSSSSSSPRSSVSELAARSRRRAREASLLAEIATSLLEHGTVERRARADLGRGGAGAAGRAGADRARRRTRADGYALVAGGRRVGTIRLEGGAADASARRRGCCRRSRRCSPSRSTASGSRARRSRPRRCAAPTR